MRASGRPSTSKPRVLLVCPTALDFDGNPIKQRRLYLPGLTFLLLGAVTPEEYELRLIFETIDEIPFHEPWDLVGLTGMGSGLVRAWQIADAFRARGTPVVIGGIAASLADPAWSLEHADAVVIGEAEELWPRVLRDFSSGRLGRIYRMGEPPAIERVPVPRYDLMSSRSLGRWRPVQATRGCPHSCKYCSVSSFFNQHQRKRPVPLVVEDIRAAKRHGSDHIIFMDDNIGVDWDYCASLWEAIIPEKVTWMSQCSLQIADRPDLLSLAHRSGCRMFSVGIESTNPESLATVQKEWNRPERYLDAIRSIRKAGIDLSAEFIIGLDADVPDVFERTYEFIMRAAISLPRVHILTPVPGTQLYAELEQDGRLISRDFSRYSGGQVVFRPAQIGAEQLQEGYWSLYERLFALPAILRRLWRNPARLGIFMRALVAGTNMHYRDHIRRRIVPGIV